MAHRKRAWDYLLEMTPRPDLLLLHEANPELAPAAVQAAWPSLVMWPLQSWRWGSAILVTEALDLRSLHAEARGYEVQGWIATGSVALPDGERAVVGSVHAPPLRVGEMDLGALDPDAVRLPPYRVPRAFDVVYATYRARVAGRRFIVGGDWNVSPYLWTLYHPRSRDALFFERARADGWVDCYRRFHRHEGRTWFRDGDLPYQFDHLFTDQRTAERMRACEIDAHPASCLKVSDHAPLVLDLDP
jgi:hypothetical protein